MKDHICIRKQIKFERIQQQFGCGYYAVCCQTQCPCPLKNKKTYDARICKDVTGVQERRRGTFWSIVE